MTIKFLACTNCRALSGTVFYVLPDRWVNFWQQEHLGHFLGEGREERPLRSQGKAGGAYFLASLQRNALCNALCNAPFLSFRQPKSGAYFLTSALLNGRT